MTTGAGLILMESACVADCVGLLLSVTFTVKLEVPRVVGVPEIVPVLLSDKPAGSVPALTTKV